MMDPARHFYMTSGCDEPPRAMESTSLHPSKSYTSSSFFQLQLRPVHGRMFWEMQLPSLAKLLTCNVVWCSHRNCEEARTLSVSQQGGRECIPFMKKQRLMFPKKDGNNGWSSDPKLVSFRFCILISLFLKNLSILSCKQTNKQTKTPIYLKPVFKIKLFKH